MSSKITTLLFVFLMTILILSDGYFNTASTHIAGAPSGSSGSVSHPATCTGCHSGGSNAVQAGWITSTVPVSGYIPGYTYSVTAMAISAGRRRFGFEITPENSAGVKKGTLASVDSRTHSAGTGYLTHTSSGTATTSDTILWTFNWTAPAAGTGTVTLWGAFLCSNSNNTSSGDLTYKANLPMVEDVTTAIESISPDSPFSVFPNPASDHITVHYSLTATAAAEIKIFDLNGRLVAPLMSELKSPGDYFDSFSFPFNMKTGVYFLEISMDSKVFVKKLLVQQ